MIAPLGDSRPLVVVVDHCGRLSGAEIAIVRLLPSFQRYRAHVILAEDGPLRDSLIEAGVSVEVLPMSPVTRDLRRESLARGVPPLRAAAGAAQYVLALRRRLRRLQPRLVHINSLKSGYYGSVAARLAGVPVLWHARDRVAPDYLPTPAVHLTRWMISGLAAGVVANSEATMVTIRVGTGRRRVHRVIYDPYRAKLPPRPRSGGMGFVVGMVGRLSPWKGQHVLLDAVGQARREIPGLRVVLVGDALFGEHGYAAELRTRCAAPDLEGVVEMVGFQADVEHVLRGFDVLVHASTVPEPFGQVVVEGMAAGLPVVATDAGGPREIIEGGVTGLLVPPGDPAALAQTLVTLAKDADRRRRIGAAAAAAAARFDPTGIASEFESVYDEVIARA